MWPWIGRQRYDGVQEEGVVLRSSRRLGASPRKVNVMSRDLITVSEVGWGLKICAFLWSQQGRIYTKIRNIHPGRSAFSMSKYPLESGVAWWSVAFGKEVCVNLKVGWRARG